MTQDIQMQSVLDRALSLARQGFYVFPVGRSKRPVTAHGHLDATTDPQLIATWFSLDFPDAMVAVHTGRSGIAVLDLDRHHEDADGFISLELGWLGFPDSFSYTTMTNDGRHIWYRVPANLNLPPQKDYRGLAAVDRKSGSSYVVVYATEIPDSLHLADAPEWLLDTKERRETGDAFEGDLDDYLATLTDGEPGEKVLKAIERIPFDYGHEELVRRQMELIRLGAEGKVGVKAALDILRESWLRDEYNTEDYAFEFDNALNTGVRKFGAQEARIANLPLYLNVMQKLGASGIDRLVGQPRSKGHYFETIRFLATQPALTEDDIASLVWNAPATMPNARDFGIDYLYSQIGDARAKVKAPVENPSLGLDTDESSLDLTLLTEEERARVEQTPTFVDAYLDWAETKVNVLNEPYHRMNALTIMSMGLGMRVFARKEVGPLGCNLFQIGLGESSSGKSESLNLRDQIITTNYASDPSYDMGSNPSPEALHETLLRRDLQCSLFNTDEAAAPLDEFLNKSYQAGAVDRLTSYYEGRVTPMLRRGNGGQGMNQTAVVSFNIALYGTPDRVISLLTKDQFRSGFLARFLWTISDTMTPDDSQYQESEVAEYIAEKDDPAAASFAAIFGRRLEVGHTGVPVLSEPIALERLSRNRKRMGEALKTHEQWDIIETSIKRLADNVRKMSVLFAAVDGCDRVQERHALEAIAHAEMFLVNLEIVARKVASSVYERDCNAIESFVLEQGGECPQARVFHRFKSWELKQTSTALDGLVAQGRVKVLEETGQRGAIVAINYGGKE